MHHQSTGGPVSGDLAPGLPPAWALPTAAEWPVWHVWFVSSLEPPALCPMETGQREEVGELWSGCLMGSPVSIPQATVAFLSLEG